MQWPFAPGGGGGWGGGNVTGQNPLGNNPTSTPTAPPTVPVPPPTQNTAPAGPPPAPPPTAPPAQPQAPQVPPNLLPTQGAGGMSMNTYNAFAQWWNQNVGGQAPDYNSWASGNIGTGTTGTGQPGAGGPVPQPNVPGTPDVMANGQPVDFNSLDAIMANFAPLFGQASPGAQIAQPTNLDAGYRGNVLDVGSGPFYGGVFGLPGREGDSVAGLIANLLFNEAGAQSGRSAEAEALLREAMLQGQTNPALDTSRLASEQAGQRLSPDSLAALRSSMQNDLSTSLAAERNASTNAMRDLGLLGQGAASGAAVGGLTNRLGALRQRGQFDITNRMEDLTNQRIGQANQTSAVGADVQRALQRDPAFALSQTLQGSRNPAIGDINDFLQGVLNLNVGQALSNRGGSFLNEGGGDLIGSLLGAAGNLGSAALLA